MKNFLRTLAGRTILFLLCVLFAFSFLASIAGILVLTSDLHNVYLLTEKEFCDYWQSGISVPDDQHLISNVLHMVYQLRYGIYFIGAGAFLIALICFIALMAVSGRKPGSDELYPGPFHRVPYDIIVAASVFFCFCMFGLVDFLDYGYSSLSIMVFVSCSALLGILCVALGLSMTTASRIKQHTLIQNTLIYRVIRFLGKVLRGVAVFVRRIALGLPLIRKVILVLAIFLVTDLVALALSGGNWEFFLFYLALEKLVQAAFLCYYFILLGRVKKGGEIISAGDARYRIDTKGMFGDVKAHAENLNNLSDGIARSVEDKLKSECMKTELITNVSHDIKTPLTSIINYGMLIGQETCENEKITEYAEVLVRQSERMKRLIEDLIEASKASTGNLEIQAAPCDASVFLSQISGEYEEKLTDKKLTPVILSCEKELRIMADSRRMWRIFDNLMNNICKYAQEGTRVYLSLEEAGGNAVFIFKNTSRDPLNMSEEELMERFTRGDGSRTTEGNGLGLSIARSMAELQGGSLHVTIDGDLFKAVLSFPLI